MGRNLISQKVKTLAILFFIFRSFLFFHFFRLDRIKKNCKQIFM